MIIGRDTILENRADLAISAIHWVSGYKAKLFPVRPDDELRRSALARRLLVDLGSELGLVYLHSPEDLILYKLSYYSLGRQTKHLRDIAGIVMTLGHELDSAYIEDWATKKGLNTLWREILRQSRA